MKVTIFSTSTCSWCHAVKRFLTHKNIEYSEVNLDEHPERIQEVRDLSGATSVPITYIQNGEKERVVIGYNPSKLMDALA